MSGVGYIKVWEYEEYCKIAEILENKVQELSYMANPIKNIPYYQIAPIDYIKNNDKLYVLNYTEVLQSVGSSMSSSKYMFSREILQKVVEAMKALTLRIQDELRSCIKNYIFKYHSIEEIEELVQCFGYKNLEIKDGSKYLQNFYYKKELPRKKTLIEYDCDCCRDGGCVCCEPYRFVDFHLSYM